MDPFENNNEENQPSEKPVYGMNNQTSNVYGENSDRQSEAPKEPIQNYNPNYNPNYYEPNYNDPRGYKPQKHKSSGQGKVYIVAVVLALLASFVGTIFANEFLTVNTLTNGTVVLYQSADTTPVKAEDATYASVAATVSNSVVEIYTEAVTMSRFGQYVESGAGSGVIISKDGYIVTNHHVIDNATSIFVRSNDGTEYTARLIGADSDSDIAVIKIDAKDLQPAVFADSDNLIVGQEVVAVGNPLGELGGSVTNGIISALDREITVEGVVMHLLQTNTAINPGNSGGGLFNMDGELIAVVNAKSYGEDIDNIGFAIPANHAKQIAQDIIELGHVSGKPSLGIKAYEISSISEAKEYGFAMAGVYVAESTNSKDLKYGDLILAVDGKEISIVQDVTNALSGKEIGDEVTVTIIRDREIKDITLELVELG